MLDYFRNFQKLNPLKISCYTVLTKVLVKIDSGIVSYVKNVFLVTIESFQLLSESIL